MPHEVAQELMRTEYRWGVAIDQVILIDNKIDDLLVRYNRAIDAHQDAQIRSLCLQIAKYEDVQRMYAIYRERMLTKIIAMNAEYEEEEEEEDQA